MRKKILAVVSAVVITTLTFTGCGSSGSGETSKSEGSQQGVTGSINVVSREEGSGTRGAFVELLGIMDEKENDLTVQTAEITNSTSVMLQTVSQNDKAIGYVSLGSLSEAVKSVQVDGADATAENVKSGTYKVSRPFNICYKEDKLTDLDKDFIKFIMSEEGQKIVNEEGYIGIEPEGKYDVKDQKGKVTLAGSTSVAPLMNKLADAYKAINSGVTIEIQESGSSAGIQSAIEGATEIGMSSRELKDEEAKELVAKQIALDGIAVIVNKNNDISNLTSEQIQKIYTGEITDWSDVK
ncbi:MAG: substrate-binding domain-containing protein [Eubacterium sp.]